MMNKNEIHKELKQFIHAAASIEAIGLMTRDGLPIDSILNKKIDTDRLSALSASLLSLADRATQEFEQGELNQVLIDNKNGFILMLKVGSNGVLTVISKPSSKLGLLLLESKKLALKLSLLIV